MERQQVIDTLKAHKMDLSKLGVESLSLFGSVARNEAGESSDVDFLVEFDKPVGLFHFFRVQHYLEEILGVKRVDLLMPSAIKPALRESIMTEAVNVA